MWQKCGEQCRVVRRIAAGFQEAQFRRNSQASMELRPCGLLAMATLKSPQAFALMPLPQTHTERLQAHKRAINMTPHMKHVVRAVEILLPRIEGEGRVTRGYVEPISKMEGIPLSAFRQARRDIRVEHQKALDGKKYRVMVLRKRPEYKGLADGYLMKGVEPWLFGPAS
jgi:hypothetical protein